MEIIVYIAFHVAFYLNTSALAFPYQLTYMELDLKAFELFQSIYCRSFQWRLFDLFKIMCASRLTFFLVGLAIQILGSHETCFSLCASPSVGFLLEPRTYLLPQARIPLELGIRATSPRAFLKCPAQCFSQGGSQLHEGQVWHSDTGGHTCPAGQIWGAIDWHIFWQKIRIFTKNFRNVGILPQASLVPRESVAISEEYDHFSCGKTETIAAQWSKWQGELLANFRAPNLSLPVVTNSHINTNDTFHLLRKCNGLASLPEVQHWYLTWFSCRRRPKASPSGGLGFTFSQRLDLSGNLRQESQG